MSNTTFPRRGFLAASAIAAGSAMSSRPAQATGEGADFAFEVMRSEAEWRERLTEQEFDILRAGGTEARKSSPLWNETREGLYSCRGCDLTLYDGYWKVVLQIGWVFFRHSEATTVMTDIDRSLYSEISVDTTGTTMAPEMTAEELRALDSLAGMEAICRRCGSHLGHIISYKNGVLHCINGAALQFRPSSA